MEGDEWEKDKEVINKYASEYLAEIEKDIKAVDEFSMESEVVEEVTEENE